MRNAGSVHSGLKLVQGEFGVFGVIFITVCVVCLVTNELVHSLVHPIRSSIFIRLFHHAFPARRSGSSCLLFTAFFPRGLVWFWIWTWLGGSSGRREGKSSCCKIRVCKVCWGHFGGVLYLCMCLLYGIPTYLPITYQFVY